MCSDDDSRMTIDLFMACSNFCPSCCSTTERMLHGICRYAVAVFTQVSELWPMGLLFTICATYLFFDPIYGVDGYGKPFHTR